MLRWKNEKGFTLTEMLIILGVVSAFLLIMAPLNSDRLQEQKEVHFLKTLQSDLLYTQMLAASHPELSVRLRINGTEQFYTIFTGTIPIVEREIPGQWIDKKHEIVFFSSGVVKQPASFLITTPRQMYKFVFPLGKGRARIETI
ncbi:hypothetical protein JNUCC1_03532 [Lentibacillus sp. JNUCC-1]|uniref:competence type IV pilus minor pilin ComGD n=1 Tax=Lentibacillus sp. JNUCC-1 TaxID=2654513 RepID=UPI0012E91806|nr:competence type IV pilus minor pilin ComGD [Lentibacillus sp. JNUCC-1]MUV39648.1 hypothetical protein [Lentibacillus sp. JNUCC-1]